MTQALKIAFNIDHFVAQRGGAERYLYELVSYLLDKGHTVHVFAMDGENTLKRDRFYFHRVPHCAWFRWLRSLSFLIMSSRLIKKEQFDVVHVLGKNLTMNVFQPHGGLHRRSYEQNILASSESKLIRCLYAVFRFLDPKQPLFFLIETFQYRRKNQPEYLAISKMVANDMQQRFQVADHKIHLIYNGINTKRFCLDVRQRHRSDIRKKLDIDNAFVWLFVGHNFKLKGLRYFLQALELFAKQNPAIPIKALIVGKQNVKYEREAASLALSEKCLFLHRYDTMEELYAAADILVQPTFYDPCSLVVLEALACGLPVISTRFNGASELIRHSETGFVVDNPRSILHIVSHAKQIRDWDSEQTACRAWESMQLYDSRQVYQRIELFYHSMLLASVGIT